MIGQPPKESLSTIGFNPDTQACVGLRCMHCLSIRITSKQTLDDHGDLHSTEERQCGAIAASVCSLRGTMTINLNLEIADGGRESHWCILQVLTKCSLIAPRIGIKRGTLASSYTRIHFRKLPDDDMSQFEERDLGTATRPM